MAKKKEMNEEQTFMKNKEVIDIKKFMLLKSKEQDDLIIDTLNKMYEGAIEVSKKHIDKVLNVAFDNKDNDTFLPHSLRVSKNGNKLTITFSKPEEIYPGKNLDITIRFKVVVKDSATATYQTLENTATVTEIKNRNNITVNDVDGTGNNSNSDYIKTKIYAVDLKKFVSKVEYTGKTNSETLVTKTDDPGYNYKYLQIHCPDSGFHLQWKIPQIPDESIHLCR